MLTEADSSLQARPWAAASRAPLRRLPRRRAGAGRGPRRWLLVGLVAVEAAALVALVRPAAERPAQLHTVTQTTVVRLGGDLRLWRAGAATPLSVTDAAVLTALDRLETGGDGRAAIAWPSGASASLEPASSIELREAAEPAPNLLLAAGGVWVRGGTGDADARAEVWASDTLRAVGARFLAQRGSAGELTLRTADAPAELIAGTLQRLVPRGSSSQALLSSGPSLPHPLPPARVLAVQVAGAGGWLVVDAAGRATGQPPGGAAVALVPGAGAPRPGRQGGSVLLPAEGGPWQVVVWGEAMPAAQVAAWTVGNETLFDDGPLDPPATALKVTMPASAGEARTLRLAADAERVQVLDAAAGRPGLPPGLRLALAPAPTPRLAAAPATEPTGPPLAPAAAVAPAVVAPVLPVEPPSAAPPPSISLESAPPPAAVAELPAAAPVEPAPPEEALALAPAATETESAAPPEPTATPAGASFGRSLLGFAPPTATSLPQPTPTSAPPDLTVTPTAAATPRVTVTAVGTTPTRAPTRPAGTPVIPTIAVPPTPFIPPTALPPTVAPRATAARGATPAVAPAGAPPGGAPPGGLGANAWGNSQPAAPAINGTGANSNAAGNGTAAGNGAAAGGTASENGTSSAAPAGGRGATRP